jgi:hypothetical protein
MHWRVLLSRADDAEPVACEWKDLWVVEGEAFRTFFLLQNISAPPYGPLASRRFADRVAPGLIWDAYFRSASITTLAEVQAIRGNCRQYTSESSQKHSAHCTVGRF